MERGTISIGPYIDQGGILGAKLEVNQKAADSVMKRTALRRNVVVVKGYGRERVNYQGSDEIELGKTITPKTKGISEGRFYTLKNNKDEWVVQMYDQEISDSIQKATEKTRKTSTYERKYVGHVNNALSEAISSASLKEKIQIAKTSTLSSANYIAFSGVGVGAVVASVAYAIEIGRLSNLLPLNEFPLVGRATPDDISKAGVIGSVLFGGIVVSTGIDAINDHTDKTLLKRWEFFAPHLPLVSAAIGELSIDLNKGRLIRLKDSKE